MIYRDAENLSRRLQIHLQRNNFTLCHHIINKAEAEQDNDDGIIIALAEIEELDQNLISILDKAGYIYLEDLVGVTHEKLLGIPSIGHKRFKALKYHVGQALLSNKRKKCEQS